MKLDGVDDLSPRLRGYPLVIMACWKSVVDDVLIGVW